jgi:hypothetical protein
MTDMLKKICIGFCIIATLVLYGWFFFVYFNKKSPVVIRDQPVGNVVTVDNVVLKDGGFVTIRSVHTYPASYLAVSPYLEPGEYTDLRIGFYRQAWDELQGKRGTAEVVLHYDSDEDKRFLEYKDKPYKDLFNKPLQTLFLLTAEQSEIVTCSQEIVDEFTGSEINTSIWDAPYNNTQQDELYQSITNDPAVFANTRQKISGDFQADIQVKNFTSEHINRPSYTAGLDFGVITGDDSSFRVVWVKNEQGSYIVASTGFHPENINTRSEGELLVVPEGAPVSLRLVRRGRDIEAFADVGDGFQKLLSKALASSEDVHIGVATIDVGALPQTITTSLDNFRLQCPR